MENKNKIFITKIDYKWIPVYKNEREIFIFNENFDYDDIKTYINKNYSFPAIYKWELKIENNYFVYIGETKNLARRIKNYFKPAKTQKVNVKLEIFLNLLKKHYDKLKSHLELKLEYLSFKLEAGSFIFTEKELKNSYLRKLVESIMILMYSNENNYSLLNL